MSASGAKRRAEFPVGAFAYCVRRNYREDLVVGLDIVPAVVVQNSAGSWSKYVVQTTDKQQLFASDLYESESDARSYAIEYLTSCIDLMEEDAARAADALRETRESLDKLKAQS